jgi:hypothetical protein
MKNFRLFSKPGSMAFVVPANRILCNDIILPEEQNPGVGLWLALNAHGPMGAVWAHNMEEALDILVDSDLANGITLEEKDLSPEDEERIARLGNNGTPCDLNDVAVERVSIIPDRDWRLLLKFAEARGAGHDNLDF